MQILKDYYLYEDLSRLNNPEYFQKDFKAQQLLDCISNLSSNKQYVEQFKNIRFYLYNLEHTQGKNIYVIAKWLLITHQIINKAKSSKIVRSIEETLSKMEEKKMETKYDTYLLNKLIKPYKHFLRKLSLLIAIKIDEQNDRNQRSKYERQFFKYNFLRYALFNFCPVLVEFTGFFQQKYPFLGQIANQIIKDLSNFLKQLRVFIKNEQNFVVTLQQLNQCEDALNQMQGNTPQGIQYSMMLTDGPVTVSKFKSLFESASKMDGIVLFSM